jgi:hypothetical protein
MATVEPPAVTARLLVLAVFAVVAIVASFVSRPKASVP